MALSTARPRERWAGEFGEIFALLKEHVKVVNQLQFSKELDGALATDEIVRQAPLVQACRQLTGGKSIKKSTIKQGFRKLGSKQFSVKKVDLDAYVTLNTNRLNDMLRCVAQAVRKDKVPQWAARFLDEEEKLQRATKKAKTAGAADCIATLLTRPVPDAASASDPVDDQSTQLEQSCATIDDSEGEEDALEDRDRQDDDHDDDDFHWVFGWDRKVQKAFRHMIATPASKEYTDVLENADNQLGSPTAVWPDGVRWLVSSITSAEACHSKSASFGSSDPAYAETQVPAHPEDPQPDVEKQAANAAPVAALPEPMVHFIGRTPQRFPCVVKDRFDKGRPPLCTIFVSGKQVCQCSVHAHGHPKALQTMLTIAQKLCAGEIAMKQMYSTRNELVGKNTRRDSKQRSDSEPQVQACMKRPMSADASMAAQPDQASQPSQRIFESPAQLRTEPSLAPLVPSVPLQTVPSSSQGPFSEPPAMEGIGIFDVFRNFLTRAPQDIE